MADWAKVNELFHLALALPAERRSAALDEACAGDASLRAEVASLLAAHDHAGDFIETPTATSAALRAVAALESVDDHGAADVVGRQVGQYRVLRVLGRGGMGVVFLAEDTRLGRTVALKAIAPSLARDARRRERLRREARAAASLIHPGIATVFALEEFGDELFIATEYVAGETLREELARGPLSAARAIDTSLQLARALAVAHDRGVVHRDLKPENVVRTPAGDVKILDFGLARVNDSGERLESLTEDGSVIGTPAYMSPEQARGQTLDFRSDLFSLGVMLYEMVSGVHPFMGESSASSIVNILEKDPKTITTHRSHDVAGPGLDWVEQIARVCLRKQAADRYASTHALVRALEQGQAAIASGLAFPTRQSSADRVAPAAQSPRWWWQFHQIAATTLYAGLLVPEWYVRRWTGGAMGQLLFITLLAAVVAASSLRMHLLFTLMQTPEEWSSQQRRSAPWIRVADLALVTTLAASAAMLTTAHGDFALLLVVAAVAALVAATIIEPATARAAFK